MNQNFISIGLKLLVAVASGIAVFVSIDRATSHNKQQQVNNPQPQVNGSQTSTNLQPVPTQKPNNQTSQTGAIVVESLRASQQTCSNVSVFLQNLVGVTESLLNLFGKGNYQVNNQPQGQMIVSGGNLVRVNPYVVASGSVTGGNCQPIYSQYGNYPV